MYHRFSPTNEDHPRRLSQQEFAWQLAYIKLYHRAWTPEDQLAACGKEFSSASSPPVVITVDDGYADFDTVAVPLLLQFNLPATVFITTGFISGQTWFWWDRLLWLLENCAQQYQTFQFLDLHIQGNPAAEDQRWSLWNTIATNLSVIGDDEKESALTDLADSLGMDIPRTAPAEFNAMSWDQIRSLRSNLIKVGAHTVNHPVLSKVEANRAQHEIRESRVHIATETGTLPDWFCYPQGGPEDYLPETVEQVRREGYRGCYTAFPNPHHNGDPMTLPRYSVPEDRLSFQWILCGAEYMITRWRTSKKH